MRQGGSQTPALVTHTPPGENRERERPANGRRLHRRRRAWPWLVGTSRKEKGQANLERKKRVRGSWSPAATAGRRRRGWAEKEGGGRPLVTGEEEEKWSSDTLKLRFWNPNHHFNHHRGGLPQPGQPSGGL